MSRSMHKQSETQVYTRVVDGELEIDPEGCIWRVKKRTADRWNGGTRVTPCKRVRAEQATGDGYLQVKAMIERTRHYASAHRLVYLHYFGPIPQGMTVNHKDGQKQNNHPQNLELATYSEQRHHAINVLGAKHHDVKGSKHPKTNLTESQVIEIRRRRLAGERIKDLATEFGSTEKAVSHICRGKTWKHCLPGSTTG